MPEPAGGIPSGGPRRRPAASGWAWLKGSLALLAAQPARLLLTAVLLQFTLGLSRLPLLGLLIVLAVPALTAGLLQAFALVADGARPSPAVLFVPLASRPRTGRLFLLGFVLFLIGLLTLSALLTGTATQIDPALLARLEQGDMQAVADLDPAVIRRFVIAIAIAVSVSGTLSFLSIPLVWFRGEKLGSSLSRGFRALVINWQAFGVLAVGLGLMAVPVGVLISLLYPLAAAGGALSVLVLGLMMLIMLGFQLVLFGTQFCAYCDIFPDWRPQQAAPASAEDQLVA